MTGRKRSLATRRKKEEMQMQNNVLLMSKELIATIWAVTMIIAVINGLVAGYFIGKKVN